jgi:hypothetical protein
VCEGVIGRVHLGSSMTSEVLNCSYRFVPFSLPLLLFSLILSSFIFVNYIFYIYAYRLFDEKESGTQEKFDLCNIHSKILSF